MNEFEFDYLNGTLTEWFDSRTWNVGEDTVETIQEEYLPRFEAAIYRNQASRALGAAYGVEDDLILANSEPKV